MKRSGVTLLDLRLGSPEASALRHPPFLRALLYAGLGGLLVGFWLIRQIENDQQQRRQAQASVQAELADLQAAQRERDARIQALQESQAQWQQHRQHQAHWQRLAQTLQVLGRSDDPTGSLAQLRWDAQGLMLGGQIAPSQLQPWLHRVAAQLPHLGPWTSVELGRGVGDELPHGSEPDGSTRFVIRFGAKAASQAFVP
jgi:hypothetical protein